MDAERLQRTIRRYKDNTDPATRLTLPVCDETGAELGTLRCLDRAWARDREIIAALTEWRARFKRYFLTQFTPTIARTEAWLNNVVLAQDDRILFLICTLEGEPIGNIGICNMAPEKGEIDNIIRGRTGGHPKLVFYAELAMMAWMFGPLELPLANGYIISNNRRSIKLHEDLGCVYVRTQKIQRMNAENDDRVVADADADDGDTILYDEMIIPKDAFVRSHPWAQQVYPGLCGEPH